MTVMLHSVIKITKNSRFLQYHLNFRAKNQTFVAKTQISFLFPQAGETFLEIFKPLCALISVILE